MMRQKRLRKRDEGVRRVRRTMMRRRNSRRKAMEKKGKEKLRGEYKEMYRWYEENAEKHLSS